MIAYIDVGCKEDFMEIKSRLKNFLDADGRLRAYPAKRKMKLYALIYLASQFDPARRYTEKEINARIDCFTAFRDPATIRRELCDYHFLGREKDGSAYWLENEQPTAAELGLAE